MKNLLCRASTVRHLVHCIGMASLVLALMSCEENPSTPNLYDPSNTGGATPSVTSVSPADSAQAAIDTLIITGQNFSTVPSNNLVFLNASSGNVVAATATQLTVTTPFVVGDSVSIAVAVQGSSKLSNAIVYKLTAAVKTFGGLTVTELAYGLATDTSGNLYAAITASNLEAGILKITQSGARSSYAPATAGTTKWNSIKMGPSNTMYAARGVRALYSFPTNGGGSAAIWTASFPGGISITEFDFDAGKNIWAGGNTANIFQVQPNKTLTPFPFLGNVRSLRAYNGYLYFSALTDSLSGRPASELGEKIWRAQITGGGLGTPEVYFNFDQAYPGSSAFGITFSSDGVLYIGTDAPGRIVVVLPNKTYSTPYATYSALLGPACYTFAWGKGDQLYVSGSNGALARISVRGKQSAPYYGGN